MSEPLTYVWEGKQWQQHVELLLRLRYGTGGYQAVPDEHKGDAGIEGFAPSDGSCFQCYAPEEPLSVQERYEAHRTKITNDVFKFINNKDKLKKVLAATKVKRWLLVVPVHDSKDTTAHCQKKTSEVQKASLPYASKEIFVGIIDQAEFVVERKRVLDEGLVHLDIPVETAASVPPLEAELLTRLDEKLEKLVAPAERPALRALFLQHFADGRLFMEKLRRHHNSIFEKVLDKKRARERNLAFRSTISPAPAKQLLGDVLIDVEKDLSALGALSDEQRSALADEFVSDWLLRCPLRFPTPT